MLAALKTGVTHTSVNSRRRQPSPAHGGVPPRDSCRVLIVDDDDWMRGFFSSVLKDARFDVELAGSGAEALQILSSTQCDILVTDWQMPGMDGPTLCRQVRDRHWERALYVMMLTVRSTRQDQLTGLAAGADDYIVKGTPVRELRARLERGRSLLRKGFLHGPQDREASPLSMHDPLTSSHNARFFNTQLPSEIMRCRRERQNLSMLSCRIDNFAQVSEHYGRDVTNEGLRAFVADVRVYVRPNIDWLARVGEDQFMVVMPGCRPRSAARIARQLRRLFARDPVATTVGPFNFTVSISVTVA